MSETERVDWKIHGVKVIPRDSLDANTAQTAGMNRAAAINFARVGAQKIWAGTVSIFANAKTGAHHHGALESVIYVVRTRPHALGRSSRICRRGWAWRFYLCAALRAAPGDQCFQRRDAGVRAGPQRQRSCGGEPEHRTGGGTEPDPVGRPDPRLSAPFALLRLG